MGFDIKSENWDGDSVMAITDDYDFLIEIVDFSPETLNDYRVIKYIDLIDETTFNALMIDDPKSLKNEICCLG